jgi:hypothetical protein
MFCQVANINIYFLTTPKTKLKMNKELEDLQDKFAFVDLMTKGGKEGLLEVLLKKKLPLEFRMEPDNHAPHIHINYKKEKHKASYRINDGVRVAGNLDNKYDKIVKSWIDENRTKLQEIWNAMKIGNQKEYEQKIGQLL